MKNKISVIIPALNEEDSIGHCLVCLLNQKKLPFEVIVVDNGSIDRTKEIIKKLIPIFKKKSIPLRYFYYPYGNQTTARSFGIKVSKGEIIGSLDAEACASDDWIEKIVKHMKNENIVGIGGRSSFRNKGFFFNSLYIMNYYLRLIFNLYCIGGGNSAFRKSAYLKVRGYSGLESLRKKENILYAKDDYFLSKKIEKIGKLEFCRDLNVTLLYRIRNKSTKHYKNQEGIKEIFKRGILEVYYDYKITRSLSNNHLEKYVRNLLIRYNKKSKSLKNSTSYLG